MSNDTQRLLTLAQDRLRRGSRSMPRSTTLAELLAQEPDDADAHALLALCLVRRRRLYAADLEASRPPCGSNRSRRSRTSRLASVSTSPGAALQIRRIAPAACTADRIRPQPPATAGARCCTRCGDGARRPLNESNARARSHRTMSRTLPFAARLAFERGRRDDAGTPSPWKRWKSIPPTSIRSSCSARSRFARGRVDDARQHAVWALQNDPQGASALTLFAAIQGAQSLLLGLWWRFQSFVAGRQRTRTVHTSACRSSSSTGVLDIAFRYAERTTTGRTYLSYAWLGFCAYTWFAPVIFWRMLAKELRQVRLRKGF